MAKTGTSNENYAAREAKWLKSKILSLVKDRRKQIMYRADPDINLEFILRRIDRDQIYRQIWAIQGLLDNEAIPDSERRVLAAHRNRLQERLDETQEDFDMAHDRFFEAGEGCALRPVQDNWLYADENLKTDSGEFETVWQKMSGQE
jgi:hypothetical protein